MVTIGIELLADRYHATAWGRAANEGEPEWPPSPWRLARSLVSAAWRLGITESREDDINALLHSLAVPPRIALPRAVAAHTRHYMPINGGLNTTLVLDPFVRTDGSPICFMWDEVDLSEDLTDLLDMLLDAVGYFGRAEAPCVARRVDQLKPGYLESIPLALAGNGDDGDIVQVLCLTDDATFAHLSESTAERQKKGLVSPPAGRFVSYMRPRGALDPPARRFVPRLEPPVHVLRFAIESAVPVPITNAIQLADRYRAAVLKRADSASPETIALLRGKEAGDGPLLQGHGHCHYLVTDEKGDRRADHLTVWCPSGFGPEAIRALDLLTLRSWTLDRPVSLVLLSRHEASDPPTTRLFAQAMIWESHTPFLPVRHPKHKAGRVVDGYEDQVRLELTRRGLPEPTDVELVREHHPSWASFRRERDRRRDPEVPAIGVRLTFTQLVQGPIAIGRHSHFGMGLFLPRA